MALPGGRPFCAFRATGFVAFEGAGCFASGLEVFLAPVFLEAAFLGARSFG
jgi:hypothetical protein